MLIQLFSQLVVYLAHMHSKAYRPTLRSAHMQCGEENKMLMQKFSDF